MSGGSASMDVMEEKKGRGGRSNHDRETEAVQGLLEINRGQASS